MKTGSESNPLITSLEKSARPLLDDYISMKDFEFKDLKVDGYNYYLANLAGNEFLSKMALKVGIYLYLYFMEGYAEDDALIEDGSMFITVESNSVNALNLAADEDYDDGDFKVKHKGRVSYYSMPFPSLIELLHNIGIRISASNLFKAIKELHEFHYLTMSPLPKKGIRTPYRHIRLYKGMLEKPIFCHLRSKEKPIRKPKLD